jgi:tetratricopeptide (TPR) repeat protein
VRATFAATGATGASTTAAYAEKAMDRASGDWLAAYRDACQATRTLHTQPESALHLRLDCLADQRLDLQAAGEIIAQPDASNLSVAIGAALSLPLPAECADAHALSVVEQPSDAAHRQAVEALRLRLARGRALIGASRSIDAIAILTPLPDEAHTLGAAALEAQSSEALERAYYANGSSGPHDFKLAVELAERAERVAVSAHLEGLAAEAAAHAALLIQRSGRPPTESGPWLQRAQDNIRRAGPGGAAEFWVECAAAMFENAQGHDSDAVAHARRAVVLADKLFGPGNPNSIYAADLFWVCADPLRLYDEGISTLRTTIAGADALFGPLSPQPVLSQLNLTEVLFDLGRTREAEDAVRNLRTRFGAQESIFAAVSLSLQGAVEAELGQRAESLRSVRQALDMLTKIGQRKDIASNEVYAYGIEAYLRAGEPRLAVDEYESFFSHWDLGWVTTYWRPLRLGGWAYLATGEPRKALPLLEKALMDGTLHPLYPGWVPRVRFQLAQSLVATHGDRKRAEALAKVAHDELVNVAVTKNLLAEVDAWRTKTFKPR